ncbi:translocation/assembly module TamB domain-containing protein [Neotabrizicola sp. VNH66]|uniref:translocation/assembly module TamB domain-containing protein n=1 Tax=Neotabrizicola sp. VNH66 TaxID=3400918 RepID=UPI003C00F2B4
MRALVPFALTAALALPLASPILAQDSGDKGYLTNFLEENLSGAGRNVVIDGFTGALSSRATIAKMTIADDTGIWLELNDVVLDWSRTALLSGQVIVNELSAKEIILTRIPAVPADETTPTPEAGTFSLPELPVSIDIGEVRADRIVLGESVLGQPLEGTLSAKLHLAGGDGTAGLTIQRTDSGPDGQIVLDASYSNATGQISVNLDAREGADGIVATKLGLPGTPAAALILQGQGTLDDFAAEFRLESDGEERLSGPITLKAAGEGARDFAAELTGNPAPLFLPAYAEFLGTDLRIGVQGRQFADGRLDLSELALQGRALTLDGTLALAADGLPEKFDLTAAIALPDGSPVLLPISGPNETRVDRADLGLKFDAAQDSGWTANLVLTGLDRPDLTLDRATLKGSGTIDRLAGQRGVAGTLDFALTAIGGLDAALLAALGPDVSGTTQFVWREGSGSFDLPQIVLNGADYGATASLAIQGLDTALTTTGRIALSAKDLSRFSALAGQSLGGAAEATVAGTIQPLTGAFDLDLSVIGTGLKSGIAEADRLLAGSSVITAKLVRDQTGLALRSFTADAGTLKLTAAGTLATAGSVLDATLDWGDLADLGGRYGGGLKASARFDGTAQNATLSLNGTGNNLRIGQPEVDRLIGGASTLAVEAALQNGTPVLRSFDLSAPNLTAEVAAAGSDGTLRVTGRLRDLALIQPEFPGPVTLSGTVRPAGQDVTLDLRAQGPAGIDLRVSGRAGASAPDLAVSGTANAAVANPFTDPVTLAGALSYDMRLSGGYALQNLSGRATLSGGSVAVPARGLSLERVAVSADLSGGSARVTATAELPRGGRLRLDGPLALAAPYRADLALTLDGLRLRDPELYETTLNGSLRLSGPMLGSAALTGNIALDETEIRVPSTGFATAADLDKVSHIGDSAAVRATRARAHAGEGGGDGGSSASGLPPWALDILISAPNRIFVRGRGLDAELGGEFRVGGTLNNIVPSGTLELIRGRLDILGKRLDLSEASLVMEGDFNPYLTVTASNTSDDVTSIVSITGPANAPEVTFSSEPQLPQEEVLAWLLFGRGLDTISAFQAAQLASAVATLAGRGGEGIIGKLRKGFGFDDLDVTTDADGSATVKAGKYISENVYTEVGVDQNGNTQINLNLDLRPGVTVKGSVKGNGNSGIGLFLEKDY